MGAAANPYRRRKILSQLQLQADAVDWFVPHSANLRMIEAISERSGIPMERTLTSVTYYGNTSAASIPLAISSPWPQEAEAWRYDIAVRLRRRLLPSGASASLA